MKNRDLLTKSEATSELIEQLLFSFGRYNAYGKIQSHLVRRIVFVCKGNICRSALSEWYLRRHGYPSASFGLDCVDGNPANAAMVKLAQKRGISLQDHRTKCVQNFEFLDGDLLVAMEPKQIIHLKKRAISAENIQFALLGLYANPRRPTVIDPFGKEERFFDETISIICGSINKLHNSIGNS